MKNLEGAFGRNYEVLEDTEERFTFQTRTEIADLLKPWHLVMIFVSLSIGLGILITMSLSSPIYHFLTGITIFIAVIFAVVIVLLLYAFKFGSTVNTVYEKTTGIGIPHEIIQHGFCRG